MGYNLYLTRADAWYDAASRPIPRDDWAAVVAADPELGWSSSDYVEMGAETGVVREYAAVWLRHPENVPFWYDNGAIETKNPDETTIRKLIELARRLNARCVGEDGEDYT